MIKHIVMWRLDEQAGDKADNALRLKQLLEGLNGRIPGLLRLEVGIDFSREGESSDVVLYSEFESRQALDSQPTSELAQESLFEAFRRKVALLEDTIGLINEMRQGDQAGAARIISNVSK